MSQQPKELEERFLGWKRSPQEAAFIIIAIEEHACLGFPEAINHALAAVRFNIAIVPQARVSDLVGPEDALSHTYVRNGMADTTTLTSA